MAKSINIYLVAMLIVGVAGQVFWFGFGTENFTAFQVIIFILASTVSTDSIKQSSKVKYQ
jgi:hypothetical protein